MPAHPADLVAGLLEHLKRVYAQKGIALQYRTAEGMCFLEPDLFKTLLVNLMDNARKALDLSLIHIWHALARVAGAGAGQSWLPCARALARRGGAARRRLQPHGRAA